MPLTAEKKRTYDAAQRRQRSSEIAEIGPPQLTDEHRDEGRRLWELCQHSLENFNIHVFPNSTGLKPFGEVQLQSIAQDQAVILEGGRVCKAEPRAYGKTSRTCNAGLWGGLYGHRRMIPVFSANLEKSKNQIMSRWKTELLGNDRLFWMFPELIWPLRCLENKPQRCASQTYHGELTHTQWTADRIVLPHIPGVVGSGAVLIALPLKSCRGATHTMPDGTILRPELVVFDDVQKDEDADNPNTIHKIEDLIDHTALMLGGHSQTMSAIMNCTVRQPDDLSEQYLKKHSWRRVRYKMLLTPATREKEFWLGKYADIRRNYDPESPDDIRRAQKESLQLYLDHRAEADEGAAATWEWAFAWQDKDPTEVSAIQHAYNILIDLGESVFAAECQNEPLRDTGGLQMLTPAEIRKKQSGYAQDVVPAECTKLICFIDPHDAIHYFQVWAFEPDFTSYMIRDDTFPNQGRRHFSHNMLAHKLTDVDYFPGRDNASTIIAGLDAMLHGCPEHGFEGLMRREWIRTDGVPMRLSLCGIDANGEEAAAIRKFIRQSQFSSLLYPSFGRGVGASQAPISLWQQSKRSGDGPEWVTTKGKPGDPPGVMFDTNFWKAQLHRALSLPDGSRGAAYLYKADPEHHRMISEHLYSERPKEVKCGSRTVYEFPKKPAGDNHKLDCAAGCRVGASKAGITSIKSAPRKKPLTLAELAAAARKAS